MFVSLPARQHVSEGRGGRSMVLVFEPRLDAFADVCDEGGEVGQRELLLQRYTGNTTVERLSRTTM